MEGVDVSELVERMGSDEDAVRKMAVFKLQSSIGDPSFADVFIAEGGLTKLRYLTLNATGNTLAYSLTSFSRLLEVDKGWEFVNQELVKRVISDHNAQDPVLTSIGRGTCRHSSSSQYPSWSHVDSGCRGLTSAHFNDQNYAASCIWFPGTEAGNRRASPVLGNACEQTVFSRSCVVHECAAVNQLSHA